MNEPSDDERSAAGQTASHSPVHMVAGPETRWTTVNFSEAIQGVQTPLSWGIWGPGLESSTRGAFRSLGIFGADEMEAPESVNDRMTGIFFGRPAGNVGFFRTVGERIPGSSADVLEQKLFGEVSGTPTLGSPGGWLRTATIAAKFPGAAFKAPRAIPTLLAQQRRWWTLNTFERPPQNLEDAQRVLREGAGRFTQVCIPHTIVAMIGPQLLEALTDLASTAAGDPALGIDLATGFGGMEETELVADLWSASRGHLQLDDIRRRHGFHGPDAGKLESTSWREDPAPIAALLRGYDKHGVADPRIREQERIAHREAISARVLAGLPAWTRPRARLVMRLARRFILAREQGKAAFLHALDGARCAARVGGTLLHDRGLLANPEDVFFLTLDEFTGRPDPSLADTVAQRKDDHERYLGCRLPRVWNGVPIPLSATHRGEEDRGANRLHGIGVVGPTVTGRARIVDDPGTADLEPGDILVCSTTDPSWTPLFVSAAALVIDTGGQMSHGAIVARELGVCCVINTVTGTRDIPDGATITVHGVSGAVEILL